MGVAWLSYYFFDLGPRGTPLDLHTKSPKRCFYHVSVFLFLHRSNKLISELSWNIRRAELWNEEQSNGFQKWSGIRIHIVETFNFNFIFNSSRLRLKTTINVHRDTEFSASNCASSSSYYIFVSKSTAVHQKNDFLSNTPVFIKLSRQCFVA